MARDEKATGVISAVIGSKGGCKLRAIFKSKVFRNESIINKRKTNHMYYMPLSLYERNPCFATCFVQSTRSR